MLIFDSETKQQDRELIIPGFYDFKMAIEDGEPVSKLEEIAKEVEQWEVIDEDGLFINEVVMGNIRFANEGYLANIVEVMLDSGADKNAIDPRVGHAYSDLTVTECIFLNWKSTDFLDYLSQHFEMKLNRFDALGETVYFWLDDECTKPIEKIEYLQDKVQNISINHLNKYDKTALDIMTEAGDVSDDILDTMESFGAKYASEL